MMEYVVREQNIDIDNECWNVNFSSKVKHMKIAGALVAVMCVSLNSEAYNYVNNKNNFSDSYIEVVEDARKGTAYLVNFSDSKSKLDVFTTSLYSKSELNKQALFTSFCANCPETEYLRLSPLYNVLSEAFKDIDFTKAVVDIVPKMSMVAIDFNLGHKILLSVSKTIKTISDENVVFSISVAGNVRANGEMSLAELVSRVRCIHQELLIV